MNDGKQHAAGVTPHTGDNQSMHGFCASNGTGTRDSPDRTNARFKRIVTLR
jgi:hypothetical protein